MFLWVLNYQSTKEEKYSPAVLDFESFIEKIMFK